MLQKTTCKAAGIPGRKRKREIRSLLQLRRFGTKGATKKNGGGGSQRKGRKNNKRLKLELCAQRNVESNNHYRERERELRGTGMRKTRGEGKSLPTRRAISGSGMAEAGGQSTS